MAQLAARAAGAWLLFYSQDRIDWRATSATEALASRSLSTAVGTTAREQCAAIFAESLIGWVFAPAIRTLHCASETAAERAVCNTEQWAGEE